MKWMRLYSGTNQYYYNSTMRLECINKMTCNNYANSDQNNPIEFFLHNAWNHQMTNFWTKNGSIAYKWNRQWISRVAPIYAFEENSKNMKILSKIDKFLVSYQIQHMKLKKEEENKCQYIEHKIKQQWKTNIATDSFQISCLAMNEIKDMVWTNTKFQLPRVIYFYNLESKFEQQ